MSRAAVAKSTPSSPASARPRSTRSSACAFHCVPTNDPDSGCTAGWRSRAGAPSPRVAQRARELDRLEIGVERLVAVHRGVVAARAQLEGREALGGRRRRAPARGRRSAGPGPARGAGGRRRRPRPGPDRRRRISSRCGAVLGPRERGIGRSRRGLVVVGEHVDVLVAAVAGQPLEPGGDRGVHPAARAARDRAVGDLAREPVHEGELALAGQRRRRARHDEAPPLERAQDRASGAASTRLQGAGPEPAAHDRGCWSTSCSASGSASIRAASSARTVAGISGSAPPSCSRWRTISSA